MNTNQYFIVAIMGIVILGLIVAGCTSQSMQQQAASPELPKHATLIWSEESSPNEYSYVIISKYYIAEDNTTCYVSQVYKGGGITCSKEE